MSRRSKQGVVQGQCTNINLASSDCTDFNCFNCHMGEETKILGSRQKHNTFDYFEKGHITYRLGIYRRIIGC